MRSTRLAGAKHQHLSRLANLEDNIAAVEFIAAPIDAVQIGNYAATFEVHRVGHRVVYSSLNTAKLQFPNH